MKQKSLFIALGVCGVAVILVGGLLIAVGMTAKDEAHVLIGNADTDSNITVEYMIGDGDPQIVKEHSKAEASGTSPITVRLSSSYYTFQQQPDRTTYFSVFATGNGIITVNDASFPAEISADGHVLTFTHFQN